MEHKTFLTWTILTALFMDICSFFEKSDGPTSLHITLNHTAPEKVIFDTCTCIINGDIRLIAVDYRPYIDDMKCATSVLYIDGQQIFPCVDESSDDFSIYYEDIPVTSNITNITMKLDDYLPQMLWIQITDSSGVSLICNRNINDSVQQTSMYTSTAVSGTTAPPHLIDNFTDSEKTSTTTATTTSLSTAEKRTEYTSIITKVEMTSASFQKDKYEGEIIPVTMIVGGSLSLLALIVIIVIICVVCKRRKCGIAQTKTKTNEYSAVTFEPKRSSKTKIMEGVVNKSYEESTEMITSKITSNSPSNYEEIDTDNAYSEPVDAVADGIHSEPAKSDVNIQNSHTFKINTGVHNYQEPYDKTGLTGGEESECNYTKVIKANKKEDVYNGFTGIDNYSHIDAVMDKRLPQHLDNYSHIKLQGEESGTPEHSDNLYSHIKVEENFSDKSQCPQVKGDKAYVDTEEYDHLGHYSHR